MVPKLEVMAALQRWRLGHRRDAGSARSLIGVLLPPHPRPAPSEHGRLRLHRLPAEEVVLAGPGMHHAATDAAFEAAGVRLGVLLPCRGVVHAATGAGEFFDRPDAVGHCTEIVL